MNSYFVAIDGQQQGPHDLNKLESLVRSGQIKGSDLCWSEGMTEWQPVSQALPALVNPLPTPSPSPVFNPYTPPKSEPSARPTVNTRTGQYGGIGRLAYVGLSFILGALNATVEAVAKDNEAAVFATVLVVIIASCVVVYQRVKNIGMNPWWFLLIFVPVANLIIGFRCLACQEGYADERRLDPAGRLVAYIFGALVLIVVALLVFGM